MHKLNVELEWKGKGRVGKLVGWGMVVHLPHTGLMPGWGDIRGFLFSGEFVTRFT